MDKIVCIAAEFSSQISKPSSGVRTLGFETSGRQKLKIKILTLILLMWRIG
jgi:hypothetical protein